MATRYLGPAFDIHGGGMDLLFPHHENEIAQSRAAGDGFAQLWLHNAWVTTSGEKMSKSLGNSLLVSEVIQRVRPVELRYYLGSAHYRSMLEFSDEAMSESAAAYRRIEGFLRRAVDRLGEMPPGPLPRAFSDAMDDDLGVPQALAVVHDTVRAGNAALDAGDEATARARAAEVRAMMSRPRTRSPRWETRDADRKAMHDVIDVLVQAALADRAQAREAQGLRCRGCDSRSTRQAGIALEDTADGVRWSLAEERVIGHGRQLVSVVARCASPGRRRAWSSVRVGQRRKALKGKGPTRRPPNAPAHPAARRA